MGDTRNDAGSSEHLVFKTGAELTEPLRLLGAEGHDAIGELFEVKLLLARSSALSHAEVDALFDKPCAVVLDSGPHQFMCGVLAELVHVDNSMTEARYVAKMVPRAQTMSLGCTSRAIVQQSVATVIEKLSQLHSLAFQLNMTSTYAARDLMVQYEESDWDFVTRWAEYMGINYWFSHSSGGDKLHWGDDLNHLDSVLPTFELPHVQRSMLQLSDPVVAVFDEVYRRGPWRAMVHDHSETNPEHPPAYEAHSGTRLAMGSKAAYAHAKFCTEDEGKLVAKRRAQRMDIERCFFRGQTNEAGLRSACWLNIRKKSGDTKKYLITRTSFVVGFPPSRAPVTGEEDVKPLRYRAHFEAVDAAKPFRVPQRVAWPKMPGVMLGYVVGEELGADAQGDQARLARPDGQGRYRVALPFVSPRVPDAGLGTMQISPPLRVTQRVSGNVEGTHTPLRAGTPVLLSFHAGNVDRPYVLGCVGHDQTQHVVTQHNPYESVVQSAARVRLEWEDQAGSEEGEASSEGGESEANNEGQGEES